MKKTIFLFFITIHTCLFSQSINKEKEITDRYVKENIAVFEIEDVSTEYRKDLSKKVTKLIENSLTRMNRFNIVDRANLDKYLKEMELQLTGITEEIKSPIQHRVIAAFIKVSALKIPFIYKILQLFI